MAVRDVLMGRYMRAGEAMVESRGKICICISVKLHQFNSKNSLIIGNAGLSTLFDDLSTPRKPKATGK